MSLVAKFFYQTTHFQTSFLKSIRDGCAFNLMCTNCFDKTLVSYDATPRATLPLENPKSSS